MSRQIATVSPWTSLNLQKTIAEFARASQQHRDGASSPAKVWHYTNAAGLIGILESGHLRGTNYAFMNDASEFEYGCAIASNVLAQLREAQEGGSFFSHVATQLEQFTTESEMYLVCFSEPGDDLSQWRGYSSGPDRFSLGFLASDLERRDPNALMRAVQYDRSAQQEDFRLFLIDAWKTIGNEGVAEIEEEAATILVPYLFDILCFYKDARFAAEREWRVAKRLSTAELADVGFSASPAGLKAFLPLCGSQSREPLPLVAVNLLSAHPDRARKFVAMLLRKCGYLNVDVTTSDIPFIV